MNHVAVSGKRKEHTMKFLLIFALCFIITPFAGSFDSVTYWIALAGIALLATWVELVPIKIIKEILRNQRAVIDRMVEKKVI